VSKETYRRLDGKREGALGNNIQVFTLLRHLDVKRKVSWDKKKNIQVFKKKNIQVFTLLRHLDVERKVSWDKKKGDLISFKRDLKET
jgi:glutaredoxin 2